MKKFLTLGCLSIFLMVQQANAQIGKGQKMLGGSINAESSKSIYETGPDETETKSTSITVAPQLGFGVGNNWIVGISAGYAYSKQRSEGVFGGNVEQRQNVFTGGLFARKFWPIGQRFGVFGQANANYGFGKGKYKSNNGPETDVDVDAYEVGITPGAFYKLGNRFVIEAGFGNLGYRYVSSEPENGVKSSISNFDFSLTNSLTLGFQIIL